MIKGTDDDLLSDGAYKVNINFKEGDYSVSYYLDRWVKAFKDWTNFQIESKHYLEEDDPRREEMEDPNRYRFYQDAKAEFNTLLTYKYLSLPQMKIIFKTLYNIHDFEHLNYALKTWEPDGTLGQYFLSLITDNIKKQYFKFNDPKAQKIADDAQYYLNKRVLSHLIAPSGSFASGKHTWIQDVETTHELFDLLDYMGYPSSLVDDALRQDKIRYAVEAERPWYTLSPTILFDSNKKSGIPNVAPKHDIVGKLINHIQNLENFIDEFDLCLVYIGRVPLHPDEITILLDLTLKWVNQLYEKNKDEYKKQTIIPNNIVSSFFYFVRKLTERFNYKRVKFSDTQKIIDILFGTEFHEYLSSYEITKYKLKIPKIELPYRVELPFERGGYATKSTLESIAIFPMTWPQVYQCLWSSPNEDFTREIIRNKWNHLTDENILTLIKTNLPWKSELYDEIFPKRNSVFVKNPATWKIIVNNIDELPTLLKHPMLFSVTNYDYITPIIKKCIAVTKKHQLEEMYSNQNPKIVKDLIMTGQYLEHGALTTIRRTLWELYDKHNLSHEQKKLVIDNHLDSTHFWTNQIGEAVGTGKWGDEKIIDTLLDEIEKHREIYLEYRKEHQHDYQGDAFDKMFDETYYPFKSYYNKLKLLFDHGKIFTPKQLDRILCITGQPWCLPGGFKPSALPQSMFYHPSDTTTLLRSSPHLTTEQIDKFLYHNEFPEYIARYIKLSPKQIDNLLDSLSKPYSKAPYKKIALYYQKSSDEQFASNILVNIYEYQTLSEEQLWKAIDLHFALDILFAYQKNITSEMIDYCIEHDISLDILYANPNLKPEQRRKVMEKMGIEVPEGIEKSPLWSGISPRILLNAVNLYKTSIKKQIEFHPLKSLVGVYPMGADPMQQIREYLNKKQYHLKTGDIDYAYITQPGGQERKKRIGKIIKDDPDLTKTYIRLKQLGKPETSDIELVISDKPEDIARKSTGQNWTSCETIGGHWGGGSKAKNSKQCGWCDDIKAHNLIAFLRHKGKDKWIGRAMIRWCIREDTVTPDAFIENYYGNKKYTKMMNDALIKILREKGFSGIPGATHCITPYRYGGYVDSGGTGAFTSAYNEMGSKLLEKKKKSKDKKDKEKYQKLFEYLKKCGDIGPPVPGIVYNVGEPDKFIIHGINEGEGGWRGIRQKDVTTMKDKPQTMFKGPQPLDKPRSLAKKKQKKTYRQKHLKGGGGVDILDYAIPLFFIVGAIGGILLIRHIHKPSQGFIPYWQEYRKIYK